MELQLLSQLGVEAVAAKPVDDPCKPFTYGTQGVPRGVRR
jgi:hypothetical protein